MNSEKPLDIIVKALKDGRTFLYEHEAKQLCKYYGIPTTEFFYATTIEEAVKYAELIGFPVVVKLVSRDVLHKSDVGGVILNVTSREEVMSACNKIKDNLLKRMPSARLEGYLVENMLGRSLEVIVGALRDAQFGPIVSFGLGGVFVEVLKDVSFRAIPLSKDDALEMIMETKGYEVLRGARGYGPLDIEAVVDVILKVSRMMEELPQIDQVDLNPIYVYPRGAKVVDARVILKA